MSDSSSEPRPGRPKKHGPRQTVIVQLTPEVVAALDTVTKNRTAYIEQVLRADAAIAAELTKQEQASETLSPMERAAQGRTFVIREAKREEQCE